MISLKVFPVILLASVATAQILSVPHGGTGNPTLTQHGPLVGNGTGAVTVISPGTAGQCLISGGPSVDPVFGPCAGGVGGGPGAGSCSVNQYVNALINGSAPTCSQITYSQIGGTVPTWNQSTTGNAATATGLSSLGTANQVWGMNAGGTAQGWQNPSGGVGGPVSVSALTGATGSNTIPNAAYPQQWTWNLGSGSATGMWFNESAAATGSSILMEISTFPNSTATPLVVYAGNNGIFNFAANGELQARGTGAKFVGPMVLTTAGNPGNPVANAAALGTDQNGNIYPVTPGGGAGVGTYYNSSEHGALGTIGISVSTVANAVAAAHFYYGKPYAVSFSTIYISVGTADNTNNSGMAIWDVTANAMLCHSLPRTTPAGVQAFSCVEGTVQLLPTHDYIFLRASAGTTLQALGNALSQVPSQYTSTNTSNCQFGSNGITCNANFSLGTYSNAGNSINFFLR